MTPRPRSSERRYSPALAASSGVEIKFEYVSGHLPANFFTEEIEIKDRVATMLFKLKLVFVSTRHDSDIPGRKDKYLDPFWLLPSMNIA